MRHRPKKSLGQNFFVDTERLSGIFDRIGVDKNDTFIEIGAGDGCLSRFFVDTCRQLELIEIDDRLFATLQKRFASSDRVSCHHADALTFDYTLVINSDIGRHRIVGNLPYNISSQIILRILVLAGVYDIHVVIQRELAQRLCAQVNTSDYGRFTLMAGIRCRAHHIVDIPPQAFFPVPKVWSSLVRITPHACVLGDNELSIFTELVAKAFQQRRKQIGNSLKSLITKDTFKRLAIDSSLRAENVSQQNYIALTRSLVQ